MTALATKRMRREEKFRIVELTLKTGTIAFHNARLCFDGAGKVVPATSALGLAVAGIHICNPKEKIDATAADKTVSVDLEVERQGEWWANATAGDAVVAADIGNVVYMLDDQTVTKTPTGRSPAGRAWRIDSVKGVLVEPLTQPGSSSTPGGGELGESALPAFAANDSVPADIEHDVVYDVPATAAASTVTLPVAAPDGTRAYFAADGTKNGHTVQYRDATGPVNLTTALTASKRHLVVAVKLGGKWFANAYIAP